MSKVKFRVINPAPRKKKRRSQNKKIRKGLLMAKTRTRKRGRKRSRRSKNPAVVYKTTPNRRHSRKSHKKSFRRRHNPDSAGVLDPTKSSNILELAAGTAGGAVAVPVIGNMLGFEGTSKYFAQGAVSIAGYFALKALGMKKAGLAFLLSGVAVTAYQAAQDYGVLAGIENTLLGFSGGDVWNMHQMAGAVPMHQMNGAVPLHGMIPSNQPIQMSMAGSNQYDKVVY